MSSRQVFLSFGSNLGDRLQNLELAVAAVQAEHIRLIKRSAVYETEPQDVSDQPWFLNMVAACETNYFPIQLLRVLQRVERDLGRVRSAHKRERGPRVIDIDILLMGSLTMETPQLTIPHPRLKTRRFVLEPLLEIDPEARLPGKNESLISYLHKTSSQKARKL